MSKGAEDLADRLAVQDAIVRYAACIDDRDYDTFRGCFTPDARFVGFDREEIEGPDAWTAFVEKTISAFSATQHLVGTPKVLLRGDEASLRAELQALHWFHEPKGRLFTLWGVYRSELRRDDGVWRFCRHSLDTHATSTTGP